jgi:hypothetical protein
MNIGTAETKIEHLQPNSWLAGNALASLCANPVVVQFLQTHF